MTDGAGKLPTNPYIGARPFRRNETIYGRAREARDLLSLLVGDRIVLLNSPSGAGKTSLIQAALIPRLEQRRFAVRPTIRVGAPSPVPGANRYLLSMMQSLEDARPAAEQLPPEQLAGLTLDAYLSQRSSQGADNGQVLIFDQFEEVLTLSPTEEEARVAFFEQLGDALADPWRWALFAIREEYVAALEHYAHLVPTRFTNTFRLDLLGVEAAAEAIRGPATSRGASFDAGVAEGLAQDLAKIVVQDAHSRPVEMLGISVEPVQLQVVCYRLWERRFPAGADQGQAISAEDVRSIGSIDNALEEYYESGVQKATAVGQVHERAVRSWVDTQLITRQGFRSQVLEGNETSFGLNGATVDGLTGAYLVREERRRGVTWLELAHDRLIAPVRANNQRWFAANLSPLQRQAEVWAAQGQLDSLLFRDAELAEAEAWAATNADGLTADERLFLDNCRAERARAEERARQARRIRNLAVGTSITAVLALIAAVTAIGFYGQANANFVRAEANGKTAVANQHVAETQQSLAVTNAQLAQTQEAIAGSNARVSKARELAAASLNRINANPELSVLLGIRAMQATKPDDPQVPEAADALQQVAQVARLTHTITFTNAPIQVAYSADGQYVASVDGTNSVQIWKDSAPITLTKIISATGAVYTLAFDPTRPVIAVGGDANLLQLWDYESGAALPAKADIGSLIFQLVYSPDGKRIGVVNDGSEVLLYDSASLTVSVRLDHAVATSIAFSPDSLLVATSSTDTLVKIWEVQTGKLIRSLRHPDRSYTLAFSPDGKWLVTGGRGPDLFIWDLSTPALPTEETQEAFRLRGHTGSIFSVAFSTEGTWLASASADARVLIWDLSAPKLVAILAGNQNLVGSIAIRPDHGEGELASVGQDGMLRIWRLGLLHPGDINGLVFSPDGHIIAGDSTGRTIIWDASSGEQLRHLEPQPTKILRVAISPRGDRIATAYSNGQVQIWDAATGKPVGPALVQSDGSAAAAFSPDGTRLVTVSGDEAVRLWDVASGTALEPVGAHAAGVKVRAVAFSPDGDLVASGDTDGVVHIWDLRTHTDKITPLTYAQGQEIASLAFSPDGQRIAVGGVSAEPEVYDLQAPATPQILKGHTSSVRVVVFSPDGTRLASVSKDQTARIWDVTSGKQIQVISLSSSSTPFSIAFSPNGRMIATGGSDGVVRLIPLATDDLLALAHARVSRQHLTDDECKVYLHQQAGCTP